MRRAFDSLYDLTGRFRIEARGSEILCGDYDMTMGFSGGDCLTSREGERCEY